MRQYCTRRKRPPVHMAYRNVHILHSTCTRWRRATVMTKPRQEMHRRPCSLWNLAVYAFRYDIILGIQIHCVELMPQRGCGWIPEPESANRPSWTRLHNIIKLPLCRTVLLSQLSVVRVRRGTYRRCASKIFLCDFERILTKFIIPVLSLKAQEWSEVFGAVNNLFAGWGILCGLYQPILALLLRQPQHYHQHHHPPGSSRWWCWGKSLKTAVRETNHRVQFSYSVCRVDNVLSKH